MISFGMWQKKRIVLYVSNPNQKLSMLLALTGVDYVKI